MGDLWTSVVCIGAGLGIANVAHVGTYGRDRLLTGLAIAAALFALAKALDLWRGRSSPGNGAENSDT